MGDINKAFNLPLSSEGEKLIEATGNVCAVFNLPNEAASIARFVNSRDEPIEQQQARIAELERYNVRLANESHEKDLKIDELAATVERLRDAGTKLRDDIDLSKIVGAGKRNFANEWDEVISATPAANLNHVKREAWIKGYQSTSGIYHGENTEYMSIVRLANQRYPKR